MRTQQGVDARIAHFALEQSHGVALPWVDVVLDIDLVLAVAALHIDAGIQVTEVAHGILYVAAATLRLHAVLDDGVFAHAPEEAVDALGGVGGGEGVGQHGHLEEVEPLAVGMLAHVALQGRGLDAGAVAHDADLLQEVIAFGYEA